MRSYGSWANMFILFILSCLAGLEEVFRLIDLVLHHIGEHCKIIICDGEGCNNLIKHVVHGCLASQYRRILPKLHFFSNVRYKEIDALKELPRLDTKLCYVNNNLLYALPGVAHAAKNASSQLMAEGKVLFYGQHWADPSGCLQNQLPIPAYCRKDVTWRSSM